MKRAAERIIVPAAKAEAGMRRQERLEPGPDGGTSDLTLYSSPRSSHPGPRYFGPATQGRRRWWQRLLDVLRGR